jgi:hypothetical protein
MYEGNTDDTIIRVQLWAEFIHQGIGIEVPISNANLQNGMTYESKWKVD